MHHGAGRERCRLVAPQPLIDALHARDWQRLMVALRPLWVHSRLLPVGHALLEKLVAAAQAHHRPPAVPADRRYAGAAGCADMPALCDAALARQPLLQAAALAAKPFAPLPVLGVPGGGRKTNFSFYDDS
jgi:hypothetical protein